MSTYRVVKAQIAKLEKQAADLLKNEIASVIAKIQALIKEYGLSAADLGLTGKSAKGVKGTRKKSAAAKPAGIPMYIDPVSAKTWTGKGKQPNWIIEGLKKGKSKADFLIAKKTVASAVAAKPAKALKKVAAKKPVAKKTAAKKPAVKKVAAKKVAVKAAVSNAVVAKV